MDFLHNVFILSDTYYRNMFLTQQQLPVMCEICCDFFISQHIIIHRSVLQQDNVSAHERSQPVIVSHFSLLKWKTCTHVHFINSLAQHPDLNLVNYRIAQKCSRGSTLEKS